MLPPSSWCPGSTLFLLGYELTLTFDFLQIIPLLQEVKERTRNGIYLSLLSSDAPNYPVAHQGNGVLGFWDMAEAQSKESRGEFGKFLLLPPSLISFGSQVPWQRIFTHSNSQGALGNLPGFRHLWKITSKKPRATTQWGQTPSPLLCAEGGLGWGWGWLDKPASRSLFSPHSSPSALCSGKLT